MVLILKEKVLVLEALVEGECLLIVIKNVYDRVSIALPLLCVCRGLSVICPKGVNEIHTRWVFD